MAVLRKLLLPLNLLVAFAQALKRVVAASPRRGAGHGRLPEFPGRHDGVLLGKPLVIHEQNSVAGLANRVLACVADRVLIGFPRAYSRAGATNPCPAAR